jgi:hypothetical protein
MSRKYTQTFIHAEYNLCLRDLRESEVGQPWKIFETNKMKDIIANLKKSMFVEPKSLSLSFRVPEFYQAWKFACVETDGS